MTGRRFVSDGDWALVPGPAALAPPFLSTHVQDIARYSPKAVADALLAMAGVEPMHGPLEDWWGWEAGRAADAPDFLRFRMTLFEGPEPAFGGFSLCASCDVDDLLAIWRALRENFPALWLHAPDCRMMSPETFAGTLAR